MYLPNQMGHVSLDLDCVTEPFMLAMPAGQPLIRKMGLAIVIGPFVHLIWQTAADNSQYLKEGMKISHNLQSYRMHLGLTQRATSLINEIWLLLLFHLV